MYPVDVFRSTLSKLTKILHLHKIRFHLTGGLTGTAYGEPRMTQDIDVVIDPIPAKSKIDALVQSFAESEFMFNEDSMRQAVAAGDLFQLLDEREALKLDIYPREMIPGELDRSEQLEIFEGVILPVVSRVDAAASKLVWISKGSHKSRRDLRAIFRNANNAQQDKIRSTAEKLSLTELLAVVLIESDEID